MAADSWPSDAELNEMRERVSEMAGVKKEGIIGYIYGFEDLDSSGLSSSAAVGIAYLLALEHANNLSISPTENII